MNKFYLELQEQTEISDVEDAFGFSKVVQILSESQKLVVGKEFPYIVPSFQLIPYFTIHWNETPISVRQGLLVYLFKFLSL